MKWGRLEFRGSEVRKVRVLVEKSGVGGVKRRKKKTGRKCCDKMEERRGKNIKSEVIRN